MIAADVSPEVHEPTRVSIRLRRIVSNDGYERLEAHVFCPVRERTLGYDTCSACPRWRGVDRSNQRDGTTLVCSDRPIAARALSSRPRPPPERPAGSVPVSSVMTGDVFCVEPHVPLATAAALLVDRGLGAVPVVDGDRRPIGIVSKGDLLRPLYEPGGGDFAGDIPRVGDVMTTVLATIPEAASLAQAAALMAYEGFQHLPVVSELDEVIGIVSATDLLRWIAESSGYLVPRRTRLQRR